MHEPDDFLPDSVNKDHRKWRADAVTAGSSVAASSCTTAEYPQWTSLRRGPLRRYEPEPHEVNSHVTNQAHEITGHDVRHKRTLGVVDLQSWEGDVEWL